MPGRATGRGILMANNNHDRFVWTGGDNLPEISQCVSCRHKHDGGAWCDAYPEPSVIPEAILRNTADHRQPYEGDHGILYEDVRLKKGS
jgi:hypothetical protein